MSFCSRILVTGASGFVGGHLVPALRLAFPAAEVIGTGLDGETAKRLDVTDRAAVCDIFAEIRPDVCLHLAGIAAIGAAAASPERARAINLQGSINIAAAILAHAPDCRLIFISSGECYGGSFRTGLALDETAALDPLNLYAATKAEAEMALLALVPDGLRLLRLRPFNHTGPGQSEAFVVPAFAAQIARIEAGMQPPVIGVGALTPERDFLDIRDVCAAYIAAIAQFDSLPAGCVMNIASGTALKIGDVLAMLLDQARLPIEVRRDQAKLRPVEIARAAGDAAQARYRLGWQPVHTARETVISVLTAQRAFISRT